MTTPVDALLILSFGGPEAPDEVMPFLRNVTRGRDVPTERLAAVADNYLTRGGVSPINAQMRTLVRKLQAHMRSGAEPALDILPVYWGNRNWHPLLAHTVERMADDGVRNALAFVPSAYSSYSGCRQYLDDIEVARRAVGPTAPVITKLAPFAERSQFIDPFVDAVGTALAQRPAETTALVGTAHSLPVAMAATCDYEDQLRTALEQVRVRTRHGGPTELAWQSRSGPPQVPWLEPDIGELLPDLATRGVTHVVCAPIGFVTDHFEVIWDLDTVAAQQAATAGLAWHRVPTPGPSESIVALIATMVAEARRSDGPGPCAPTCCPPPGH